MIFVVWVTFWGLSLSKCFVLDVRVRLGVLLFIPWMMTIAYVVKIVLPVISTVAFIAIDDRCHTALREYCTPDDDVIYRPGFDGSSRAVTQCCLRGSFCDVYRRHPDKGIGLTLNAPSSS